MFSKSTKSFYFMTRETDPNTGFPVSSGVLSAVDTADAKHLIGLWLNQLPGKKTTYAVKIVEVLENPLIEGAHGWNQYGNRDEPHLISTGVGR